MYNECAICKCNTCQEDTCKSDSCNECSREGNVVNPVLDDCHGYCSISEVDEA